MYCTKCGKKNADDRLFCGFCGSPLDTNEPSEAKEDVERRLYGRPTAAQSAPAPAVEPAGCGTSPGARSGGAGAHVPPRPPRQDD